MTVIRTPLALLLESVGAGEWLLILAVILIVYGPARLPEMARRLGHWVARFQKSADSFRAHVADLALDAEPPREDPPTSEALAKPCKRKESEFRKSGFRPETLTEPRTLNPPLAQTGGFASASSIDPIAAPGVGDATPGHPQP